MESTLPLRFHQTLTLARSQPEAASPAYGLSLASSFCLALKHQPLLEYGGLHFTSMLLYRLCSLQTKLDVLHVTLPVSFGCECTDLNDLPSSLTRAAGARDDKESRALGTHQEDSDEDLLRQRSSIYSSE